MRKFVTKNGSSSTEKPNQITNQQEKISVESHKKKHDKVYLVTTTADTGKGSLRDAINNVNADASHHPAIIRFKIPEPEATVVSGKKQYIISPGQTTSGLSLPAFRYPAKIKGKNSDKGRIQLNGQHASITTVTIANFPTGLAFLNDASYSTVKNLNFINFSISIFLSALRNVNIRHNVFNQTVTLQNSILGLSVSDLTVYKNAFNPTVDDVNGVYLVNPTNKVKVDENTFSNFASVTNATAGNGIYVVLESGETLDTLNVQGNTFLNFANPLAGTGGNAIYVDFENTGTTLSNYIVKGNKFENLLDGSIGVVAYLNSSDSRVKNFIVKENSFNNLTSDNSNQSIGVSATTPASNSVIDECDFTENKFTNLSYASGIMASTLGTNSLIKHITISKSSFKNILNDSQGINIFSGSEIDEIKIKECYFENISVNTEAPSQSMGIDILSSSEINNIIITECNIKDISNSGFGILVYTENGNINNCNILETDISDITSNSIGVIYAVVGGVFENASISDTTFKNLSEGSIGFVPVLLGPASIFGAINISNNDFKHLATGSSGIGQIGPVAGTIDNFNISDNDFDDIQDVSNGIALNNYPITPLYLSITKNDFKGKNVTDSSWAVYVNLLSGNMCLEFLHNKAHPETTPPPYDFEGSGGTFTRTRGSDNTTNTGTIVLSGVVAPPGSC